MSSVNFGDFFGAGGNKNEVDDMVKSILGKNSTTSSTYSNDLSSYFQSLVNTINSIDDQTVEALVGEIKDIIYKAKPLGKMVFDLIKENKKYVLDNIDVINLSAQVRYAKFDALIKAGFSREESFQITMLDISKDANLAKAIQELADKVSKNTTGSR